MTPATFIVFVLLIETVKETLHLWGVVFGSNSSPTEVFSLRELCRFEEEDFLLQEVKLLQTKAQQPIRKNGLVALLRFHVYGYFVSSSNFVKLFYEFIRILKDKN